MSEQMLSKSQVEFYRANGYVVVEGVLTSARIAALRAVADRSVEASRAVNTADEVFDLEPGHSSEAPKVQQVKDPAAIDETYGELVRQSSPPRSCRAARWAKHPAPRVEAEHEVRRVRQPSRVAPDWAFYPHTNDDLLAVGVAIDGMTVENGCLLVLPGSHKGPVLDHHAKEGSSAQLSRG